MVDLTRKLYQGPFFDNTRWDDVVLRQGDIIITTPPKSGTTWTQMICALLIFQTADLPKPLDDLSPWPDYLVYPRAHVPTVLAGQRHRRFIKTHTPMDGLPYDERVSYLSVGRDPRDAFVSYDNHMANMDLGAISRRYVAAGRVDGIERSPFPAVPPPPGSIHDRFRLWVDSPAFMFGMPAYLAHLDTVWQERDRPNVILMHYQRLKDDLEGSMRALAAGLEIDVPERKWPELVEAATFGAMKRHETDVIPDRGIWRDESRFLNKGTYGQWRSVLDDEDVAYYRERVATMAGPELLDWVQQGIR
ncbi:sulfotransferase domain-containing protein [Actinoplanes sp. TBRC 11911]|uniref:sulfotransferase domain-containing protein n=1 Tax=Actinoplanes sp. TBRC 11911 TaxID=2729386 RepID=UPI00145F84CB|nr:sulfotransferase domain-containing protein [Actinoplanes sp. TBRC 11911]NMO50997.1 sulfotransferase domain-containing protein [Actinoplanes sp. TBRC 11911]